MKELKHYKSVIEKQIEDAKETFNTPEAVAHALESSLYPLLIELSDKRQRVVAHITSFDKCGQGSFASLACEEQDVLNIKSVTKSIVVNISIIPTTSPPSPSPVSPSPVSLSPVSLSSTIGSNSVKATSMIPVLVEPSPSLIDDKPKSVFARYNNNII